MNKRTEGNLQIAFPVNTSFRKFDDKDRHLLNHCMKAVDFIVETDDRLLFIEFKDPDHPDAKPVQREKFADSFCSGRLNEDLKYKYRDSFLYEWASGNTGKPVYYWILLAMDNLTEADLLVQTEDLKRKLPLRGPASGAWVRQIVADCMIFNIKTWNRHLKDFPVSRIPD